MKIISLELIKNGHSYIYDIKKENHILIKKYDGYIDFYNAFYEVYNMRNKFHEIKLAKSTLNNKNSVFIDLSSLDKIMDNLLYKKNNLLYNYVFEKYNDLSKKYTTKIFDIYSDFINDIEDEDLIFDLDVDVDKDFFSNIDVTLDISNYKNIILKILSNFLENNKEKIIVIFINSEILKIDLSKYSNVYLFDIGKIYEVEKYNLLSTYEIKCLNFDMLVGHLINILPFNINSEEVQSALQAYLRYFIYFDVIVPENIHEYIFSTVLSKSFSLSQKIINKNLKIDSELKSFLNNL